jgi:Ca2+-binding EF-hand superfamily protein
MVDTDKYATTFAMLDRDGDGRISAAEFKELMGTLGVAFTDETAARAIEMMDADGDGLVSLEELASYMSSPAARVLIPRPRGRSRRRRPTPMIGRVEPPCR